MSGVNKPSEPYDFGDLAFGGVDEISDLLASKKNTRVSVKVVKETHAPSWYHDVRTRAAVNLHLTDATHKRYVLDLSLMNATWSNPLQFEERFTSCFELQTSLKSNMMGISGARNSCTTILG
jgi:hypothetical protein